MTREEKEQWDIFMKTWVIPALKNTWGEKKCKEIVEALEEWEEQEQWIPTSERLPETNDDVLVYDGTDIYVAWYMWQGWNRGWNSGDYAFDRDTPIIAWMPLPVPYESQESEV